ncbi:GTP cyclohydrolase II [Litoreibacter roseus]|uniref:GTP cyclohydrolase-2 n=1 Tax=Litoreibacter roseus TaxID=2601869 RepID=A0A6N6JJN0_9RHOB|nr:GTP cyclohydrolase II [Litoreibacter roseus]GFE66265.1 GTP cyclohydrolase-2 [Litoreibacter roseus]
MGLALTSSELIARARGDLRAGAPVVVGNHLVIAAEVLAKHRFEALKSLNCPLTLALSRHRANTLKIRSYDGDVARMIVPADAESTWVRAMADPTLDLRHPMKGPVSSIRDGDAADALCAVVLVKSARLLPAAMLAPVAAVAPEDTSGLCHLSLDALRSEAVRQHIFEPIVSAKLPLSAHPEGRLHVFQSDDGTEEHYAIEIGAPDRSAPVLSRLHSACFTGDLLGSLKCDCGPQLRAALAMMGSEGHGILLYLNQEGRGIGLTNKMRAYALQDQGFDTVDANHRLGFEDDERDFRIGASLLKRLGFHAVRLLTNNPAKMKMLQENGVGVVERVPLKVGLTKENARYLATKAERSGHLL